VMGGRFFLPAVVRMTVLRQAPWRGKVRSGAVETCDKVGDGGCPATAVRLAVEETVKNLASVRSTEIDCLGLSSLDQV